MKYQTIDEYKNDCSYRSLMNRIGISLLMFMTLFYSTNGISSVLEAVAYEFISDAAYAETVAILIYSVAYFLSFMLPAVLFKIISRSKPYRKVKLNIRFSKNTALTVFAGMATVRAAVFINALLVQSISGGYAVPEDSPTVYGLILNVIYIALVPAICEEFLFRGVFLENMLPYGKLGAIVGSAILFGIMHQNAAQLFYATVAGIVFAIVYIKTESLWTGMLTHFLNNALSVIDDFVLAKWGQMTYSVFYAVEMIIIIALGIISVLILTFKEDELRPDKVSFKEGIYLKEMPQSDDFAEHPISVKSAITGFFAPANAVFIALTVVLMIITAALTSLLV